QGNIPGNDSERLQHPNWDDFWEADRSKLENIDIPVWMWGGWDDTLTGTSSTLVHTGFGPIKPVSSPDKMLSMGWVSHTGSAPGFNQDQEALRWFDHWIRGINNGIENAVKTNGGTGRFRYQNYQEWIPRVAPDYPIPGTAYTPMYLNAGS